MKITTSKSIKTKIKYITQHTFNSKNGNDTTIIIVHTEDGNFSNFMGIWEKQKLNIDEMQDGDDIEIWYTTYNDTIHNHEYKNFIRIKKIEKGEA